MPVQQNFFKVWPDEDELLPDEFPTREAADVAAKRLEVETGRGVDVLGDSRWVESEQEKASKTTLYLLTCEMCNGEYGSVVHRTIHESVEGAKKYHTGVLNPEDLKGEDAINEWREDKNEPGTLEFRTGSWGFVVWEIRPLKLIP